MGKEFKKKTKTINRSLPTIITTYINGLTRIIGLDDTYQSWPIKGYDNDLVEESPYVLTTQEGARNKSRPPEPFYEDDVPPQDLTLLEYSKVPIEQSADPWLVTGSRAPQSNNSCHRCTTMASNDSN